MRLLTLLPIARNIRKDTLSYFGSDDVPLGTIVSIPLRNKTIKGIVVESISAQEAKSDIKQMNFVVKKITGLKDNIIFPEHILSASKILAHKSAATLGAVIASTVPTLYIENPSLFDIQNPTPNKQSYFHTKAIQTDTETRINTYRSIVRESFAKKQSIFILTPTIEKALILSSQLSRGIEDYTITLHQKSKTKFLESLTRIKDKNHALLIIGTMHGLSCIPSDTGIIIVEEESSAFYKQRQRPFFDVRIVAESYAEALHIPIIFGDTLLSIHTLARLKEGTVTEYGHIERRDRDSVKTQIITILKKENAKQKFSIFDHRTIEIIQQKIAQNKKIILYATRRGIAPQTVCSDCGTPVLCSNCESPLVLHTVKEKRFFICHHCGTREDSLKKCTHCDSWNLTPLGIGIERIVEELSSFVKDPIIRIDSDTHKTRKSITESIKSFFTTKSILVTTELGMPFIEEKSVDYAIIPSLDSLFSLPDFRTNERIVHIIIDLKSKTTDTLVIQTRTQNNTLLAYAGTGDYDTFIKEEIKARQDFGYPPYSSLIKISLTTSREKIKDETQKMKDIFEEYTPLVFPAYTKSKKNTVTLHLLLKLPHKQKLDEKLVGLLQSLPPFISVDTTPTHIL